MQQGPLSLTSALEVADFDPETEAERKRGRGLAREDDELLPKFDANHGNRPGETARAARRECRMGPR